MRQLIRRILLRQNFFPTWIGIFVNPFYFARAGLAKAVTRHAERLSGRLLDVGCGSMPYRELFNVSEYIGLDIDTPATRARGAADFYYDGGRFPFPDGSFDSVLCNQVLEHVFNPVEFVQEIYRILVPGGQLLLTVPFVWDEHEQPWDYARYSSFGLGHLLTAGGFALEIQEKVGADAGVLFQLLNAYLYKVTEKWPRGARFLFSVTVMSTVNLSGLFWRKVLPRNSDLYLDQIVLGVKAI